MEDFYNNLFLVYFDYMTKNSKYNPDVVKKAPQRSVYFPTIEFKMMNDNIDNNSCSIDNLDYYSYVYLQVSIYTINDKDIDKSIISDELSKLTNKFFLKIGMLKTEQEDDAPNSDQTVLRRIISYEGKVYNKNYLIRKM